jgi:hypothetical protein
MAPLQVPVMQVATGQSSMGSVPAVALPQAPEPLQTRQVLVHQSYGSVWAATFMQAPAPSQYLQVPQLVPPPSLPRLPRGRTPQAPAPSQVPVMHVAAAQSLRGSVPEVVLPQAPEPLQILQTAAQSL